MSWVAVWTYGASTQAHSWSPGSKKSRDMHAQMTGATAYYGAKRAITFENVFLYFVFEVTVIFEVTQLGGDGTWVCDLFFYSSTIFMFQGDKSFWFIWFMRMAW